MGREYQTQLPIIATIAKIAEIENQNLSRELK